MKGIGPEAEVSRRVKKYFFKKAKKYLLVEKKVVLLRPPNEGNEARGRRGFTYAKATVNKKDVLN